MIRAHLPDTPRHRQAGVTLIEMMIVLVVIGVATGAVTLGLGLLSRDDQAQAEARRLAAAISLGVDDALISATPRQVIWDAQGYRIGAGARHLLDAGVVLARGDGLADAAVLSAGADSAPVVFSLSGGGAAWDVIFDGLSVRAQMAQGAAP